MSEFMIVVPRICLLGIKPERMTLIYIYRSPTLFPETDVYVIYVFMVRMQRVRLLTRSSPSWSHHCSVCHQEMHY